MKRLALAGALALTACGHPAVDVAPATTTTSSTTTTSTTTSTVLVTPSRPDPARTTTTRVSRSAARPRPSVSSRAPVAAAGSTHLSSTAYCETGLTASGQHPYFGSAAGNRWPFGTRLHIVELGRDVIINDRIGRGSELDIAFPGNCPAARAYGRRTITIQVVAA